MSEWEKGKREARPEARQMEKEVEGYSYSDPKRADQTDNKVKKLIADPINKARDYIFPMIEESYLDSDMESAGALEDVMQWLNIFLLELGLPLEWSEDANHRQFARVIKADVALLKSASRLPEIMLKMQKDELGDSRMHVVRKCATIKKYVTEMLVAFKRRRHSLGG